VLQAALGALLFTGGLPLSVALAHNMTAALLLTAVLGLAAGGKRRRSAYENESGSPVGPSAR